MPAINEQPENETSYRRRAGRFPPTRAVGAKWGLPPADLAAEQALLGALLANNRVYDRVREFLAPGHFADPVHARIYETIARRIEAGQGADTITLRTEFERAGTLDEIGGTAYLAQLLTSMVGTIRAADYGGAIRGAWLGRLLIGAGTTLLGDEAAGSNTDQLEDGTSIPEDEMLLDLATDEARRLVGVAHQEDESADREARLLLDRIHSGLDEAHARADRLLARLS
jgi:hypothetical protein